MPLPTGRKVIGMTRRSVATSRRVPCAPMGDYVWRLSRQVILSGPFAYGWGRTQRKWVYYMRGRRNFVRPWVMPANPRTSFQVDQRQRLVAAQREWQRLTDAQRDGWERAGVQFDPELATLSSARRTRGGMNLFAGAQIQRLSWGEAMRHDPPGAVAQGGRARRPAGPHHLHEVPVAEGEGLALRIDHMQKDIAGCRLLVEMTPATKSLRNKPLERWLTKAGDTDQGSYFALQPSGGQYLLPTPRYAIAPGQRFAIRVTILDADGLRSRSHMADLIREENAAPAAFAHTANQYPDREGEDQAPSLGEQATLSQLTAHPRQSTPTLAAMPAQDFWSPPTGGLDSAVADDAYRMMRGRSPAPP